MKFPKFSAVSTIVLSITLISSCGTHNSGDANATDTNTSSRSSTSDLGNQAQQSPAYGLTFSAPNSITSDKQPIKDEEGRSRINYYITKKESPLFVDVEYYVNSSQKAAGVLEKDKEAYASDGTPIHPEKTEIKNSPDAYTFSWEQSAPPPWNDETAKIDLSCRAVLADGPSGYSYGIYVCAPKGNNTSIETMNSVLDSITIAQS